MPAVGPRIETVVSPEFAQNAFVVWKPGNDEALVVDPGFNTDGLLEILRREGLRLVAILNTHGHADHIAGNATLKAAFPGVPLIIGRREAVLLADPWANLSAPFGQPLTSPEADRLVEEGETIELAGLVLGVREIPGHSPGSVVYVAEGEDPPIVLAGDVLFAGSVGRTDFPGGSAETLFAGIRSKLFSLPDAAIVYPGHGPATTVGAERRSNPFVGEGAGGFGLG